MSRILEIGVDSIASLDAASEGGADRIELCSALGLGGLTPSPGLIALAVAQALPCRAMIRPRPGDFTYDAAEITQMERDIDHARSEEHTSELQSLMRISYAVFCLKKKKNKEH